MNSSPERNTEREESELVAALRRREPRAMEVLYDRVARQAFGLAYRILGDGPSAEDVVQEAFLTLWRNADRVDQARGKLNSFLLTIVHHKAIDALRAKRGQTGRHIPIEFAEAEKLSDDVAERVLLTVDRDDVKNALAAVPDDQRQAIEMAYYQALTHVEIAEALQLPLGTVKSRLRLGLEKMRTILKRETADELRRS